MLAAGRIPSLCTGTLAVWRIPSLCTGTLAVWRIPSLCAGMRPDARRISSLYTATLAAVMICRYNIEHIVIPKKNQPLGIYNIIDTYTECIKHY
jgi:hypothetical protein